MADDTPGMTLEELTAESFQVEHQGGSTRLLVRRIVWDGHEPCAEWDLVALVAGHHSIRELPEQVQAALGDRRYFRTCRRCGEFLAAGWMHDQETCQACAERHLGVVY